MSTQKPGFDQRLESEKGLKDYQTVADTVGMVPSLRIKDNVIQAVVVVVGLLIGVGAGSLLFAPALKLEWWQGAMVGALAGLVISTLLSGGVIMVLGWVRAAKRM